MTKHTVLTIDDHEDNNLLIKYYLGKSFEVQIAKSGKDGLDILDKSNVEVVLLDIMMPGMNGYEVLDAMLATPKLKNIPVIMVTARTEMEDVREALTKGAFDYVKKPIDFTEIHHKINVAIKYKKQSDELSRISNYKQFYEGLIHARRLQQSILPDKQFFRSIFPESFVIDLPRDIISGDYYWVNARHSNKFLGAFDCTGHGVPGAMLSVMGNILMNKAILQDGAISPKDIFRSLACDFNASLNNSTDTYTIHDGMDGIFCSFNEEKKQIEYVSANRPLIIIRDAKKPLFYNESMIEASLSDDKYSIYLLKGDMRSIGRESSAINFKNHVIDLCEDDIIYLFTDGITDQINECGKNLSKKKLLEFLLGIQDQSLKNQKVALYNYIDSWRKDAPQTDDILVIAVQYKSPQ
ncbi:MAG: hypothetical protein A2275_00255 [Bacteroidetes bacterium RIFOXYA12_FULL_35_11]|nr:MAG: hypothetical protein A2X01_20590 [Bacteroidetes bacterium GWF2_35_48]OFY83576.1 MAG: hypothetical protein A2275_00255 [Bacteroidetes bacterium RIFOXYA12_FULL_35_11]OFY95870.1 MAG: hypothetical protein A2491_09880 [Bacteroidetes bacterium RIFOXYC12_FULL_35_7]HBX51762.1 hypothetical protein [Bacteroidales bacterium]